MLRYQTQLQEQHQETPDAAPAPAAAPAPGNAAPVPSETIDDDAQIIEDLRKDYFAKKNEPDPEKKPEEKPAKGKKAKPAAKEPEPEEEPEGEPESEEEPEEEPAKGKNERRPYNPEGLKYKTPEDAVTAIVAALESGDAKKIAAAVGKPESFLKVSDAKWLAFREQTKAVRERERTVTRREHEFNTKLAEARKEHQPILEAAAAYRDGKYDRFVSMIELITGDRYDEATSKVIKGETALSPEVKALRKELAELRAEKQREKKEAEEAAQRNNQQAQYQKAVGMVQKELAAHPVAKVKGYEQMVLSKVRESWDGAEYTMSFDEAADEILEDRRAEAERLGAVFTRTKRPPTHDEVRVPSRAHAADARPSEKDPWLERDLTEEELVASIERDARSGRIRQV